MPFYDLDNEFHQPVLSNVEATEPGRFYDLDDATSGASALGVLQAEINAAKAAAARRAPVRRVAPRVVAAPRPRRILGGPSGFHLGTPAPPVGQVASPWGNVPAGSFSDSSPGGGGGASSPGGSADDGNTSDDPSPTDGHSDDQGSADVPDDGSAPDDGSETSGASNGGSDITCKVRIWRKGALICGSCRCETAYGPVILKACADPKVIGALQAKLDAGLPPAKAVGTALRETESAVRKELLTQAGEVPTSPAAPAVKAAGKLMQDARSGNAPDQVRACLASLTARAAQGDPKAKAGIALLKSLCAPGSYVNTGGFPSRHGAGINIGAGPLALTAAQHDRIAAAFAKVQHTALPKPPPNTTPPPTAAKVNLSFQHKTVNGVTLPVKTSGWYG
jgi:hypothetical protein